MKLVLDEWIVREVIDTLFMARTTILGITRLDSPQVVAKKSANETAITWRISRAIDIIQQSEQPKADFKEEVNRYIEDNFEDFEGDAYVLHCARHFYELGLNARKEMTPKPMHIRTRVHTLQEGWDLCCAIMRLGYDGVQNDRTRYNDIALSAAFRQKGYCWVGVWGYSLYILNTHDKEGRRRLKDLGKCKFIEELGLSVRKRDLPKSLKFYAKKED